MYDDKVFNKSIDHIKGVGKSRAELLRKLGLFTIGDILYHFPTRYENRSQLKKLSELADGEQTSFSGYVCSKVSIIRIRRGLTIYKAKIRDDSGTAFVFWHNQPYIRKNLIPGETYVFYGRISRRKSVVEIANPAMELLDDEAPDSALSIVPVYASTQGLSQNMLRKFVKMAMEMVGDATLEFVPEHIRSRYQLKSWNWCLKQIHAPEKLECIEEARKRFAFEELLMLTLGMLAVKNAGLNQQGRGIVFLNGALTGGENKVKESILPELQAHLPYGLTAAQLRVIGEIEKDMETNKPMNRLVQGDVGSGKTVVAVAAMLKAVRCGYQAAMMAPTEILARQHYQSISELLTPMGVEVRLLVGSMSAAARREVLDAAAGGQAQIVIGTHALIQGGVNFCRLGLAITDEQHRFGVKQRATLALKGGDAGENEQPDVLIMTATPIPRTLALILFGDLDISVIDEYPPGRMVVDTFTVDETMRERINAFIRRLVNEGRQVYIVCPLVEESEEVEAQSAVEFAEHLQQDVFKDYSIGLLYGSMPAKDKDEAMRRFAAGETQVLVSTTVIEVGVNVPNAALMIVENAERFGLAQLHQLRGRVGRGVHKSFCVLFYSGNSPEIRQRMDIMKETNNGFVIAEKDLELRGTGEFFGTRQHGLPELKVANLYRDVELLKLAQDAALALMKDDERLEKPENSLLKSIVDNRFFSRLKDIALN